MKLVHCLGPRTGSSIIARSLDLSCGFRVCYEPFNPDCHNGRFAMDYETRNRKARQKGKDTFEDAYEAILEDRQGWDLTKHLDPQLNIEDNLKLMDRCESIVYLYRKSIFDMCISTYLSMSLKKETGFKFWNFTNGVLLNDKSFMPKDQKRSYSAYISTKRPPINYDWFKGELDEFMERHAQIQKDLTGRNFMVESYERFYSDPGQRFLTMVDFLGGTVVSDEWKKMMRPQNKISFNRMKDLIPNYSEIEELRQEYTLDD